MKAIHVRTGAQTEKFDLFNTALSALCWRRYNGEIELICDKTAADYYDKIGITNIWDDIKITLPDDLEGINPRMFWAAGKLLALREVSAPVALLDTDFIVWKKLQFNENIIAAHREDLHPDVYPESDFFKMKPGYSFNKDFNYAALPLNTAFVYLPDEDFKQFYVSMAIEFMKSACDTDDNLRYMVYAEQRMLALCADYLNFEVETLLDKDRLFEPQDDFTHLWGEKQKMRENPKSAKLFTDRCAKRIKEDFQDYEYIIKLIERIENDH